MLYISLACSFFTVANSKQLGICNVRKLLHLVVALVSSASLPDRQRKKSAAYAAEIRWIALQMELDCDGLQTFIDDFTTAKEVIPSNQFSAVEILRPLCHLPLDLVGMLLRRALIWDTTTTRKNVLVASDWLALVTMGTPWTSTAVLLSPLRLFRFPQVMADPSTPVCCTSALSTRILRRHQA